MPRQKQPELTNWKLVDAYLAACSEEDRVSAQTLLANIEANYKRRSEARGRNVPFGAWMAKDLLGGLLRWSLQQDGQHYILGDL